MTDYDWISFTSDFGLCDGFVAACHGVLARLAPSRRVIDVAHEIPPGDIGRAAAVLASTVPWLPESVHLAVVDPGVGTARRPVVLVTAHGLLVGPDNGLLVPAAKALGGVERAFELTNPEWFAPRVSATFHGRDIFAPVTARLTLGGNPADTGPAIDPATLVRLSEPVVTATDRWFEAEVRTIDRFGNVQLAADGQLLDRYGQHMAIAGVQARRVSTFGDAPNGTLILFVDSAGMVAIGITGARAAIALRLSPGDLVRIDVMD